MVFCAKPAGMHRDLVFTKLVITQEEELMAIITLTQQAFNGARELARGISDLLDYRLVSRNEIVEKTAQYGMSKDRLDRAKSRRLGVMRRMDQGWRNYRIYSQAALTKEIRRGCLVYLGANGLARFRDFPNVLNVQVHADIEHRIDNLMKRSEYSLSRKKAKHLIEQIDDRTETWRNTFNLDGQIRSYDFDLDIELGQTNVLDACGLIRAALERQEYQTTYKSLEAIDLLTVAAELRARIAMRDDVMDDDIGVAVQDGVIVVNGSVRSIEDLNGIKELID